MQGKATESCVSHGLAINLVVVNQINLAIASIYSIRFTTKTF